MLVWRVAVSLGLLLSGGKTVKQDYRVFEGIQEITKDLTFKGTVGYTISGESIEMRIEKIAHNYNGSTGSLKIALWACSDPVTNRQWTGYKLAKARLDPLESGYFYTNVVKTVQCSAPASGYYYIVMQLSGYGDRGWVGKDYRQFDDMAFFK